VIAFAELLKFSSSDEELFRGLLIFSFTCPEFSWQIVNIQTSFN